MLFLRQNMSALILNALFFITSFVLLTTGHQFNVGGKCGWTPNPRENYNHWAGRNRFQVNDTLYFKYNKNTDSVLYVDEADYNNCNTSNPLVKLEEGESIFKFDRSGPYFFITRNATNCQKGQKLIVVVLAVRRHVHPPSAPPSSPDHPPVPIPSPTPGWNSPVAAPSPSEYSPPGKSAGMRVQGVWPVVLAGVCVLLGFSVIGG